MSRCVTFVTIMEPEVQVNSKKVKVKDLRKKLGGITQEQLAERLGLPRTSITNLESGRPLEWLERAIELDKLCQDVGLRLSDLALPNEEN